MQQRGGIVASGMVYSNNHIRGGMRRQFFDSGDYCFKIFAARFYFYSLESVMPVSDHDGIWNNRHFVKGSMDVNTDVDFQDSSPFVYNENEGGLTGTTTIFYSAYTQDAVNNLLVFRSYLSLRVNIASDL